MLVCRFGWFGSVAGCFVGGGLVVLCCLVGLGVWRDFVCFTCVWGVVVWYFVFVCGLRTLLFGLSGFVCVVCLTWVMWCLVILVFVYVCMWFVYVCLCVLRLIVLV